MPIDDLRPLFTGRSAAKVRPALAMSPVRRAPQLVLDAETIGLLRGGLGFYDMEIGGSPTSTTLTSCGCGGRGPVIRYTRPG